MSSPPTLLTVPPEIRSVILQYLFDTPRLIPVRCPSRCRLRQSRVDKDDPSGILYVCQLLREEAVPPFFNVNTLRFRHTSEILEFLDDTGLDPRLKYNITRIVVDDGDVMDLSAFKSSQFSAISNTFTKMPNLQALETRIWARSDNAHYLSNLRKLCKHWKEMKKARLPVSAKARSPTTSYFDVVLNDPQPGLSDQEQDLAMNAMQNANLHLTIHESKEKYATSAMSRLTQPEDVHLHVCNFLLSKCPYEKRKLDCAKNAVLQRMKVAGATHIQDDNVLERVTWSVDDFPWLINSRPFGERYH